jgi:Fic-DOC domain mobile mystery protein B
MFNKTWKWAGSLRKTNKNIGCDYHQIPIQLKTLNDDAEFWLKNSTYFIDQLALVYHHRLVKIHLFPNGNGRHARMVADSIIKKYKSENNIKWEGNQNLPQEALRKKYIEALQKADIGNYELLFKLFL